MRAEVDRGLPRAAISEQVVESLATGSALQPIDAAVAAIVQHHDGKLRAEHHRRGYLGVHHQVTAVADQHDHLAVGRASFTPKPPAIS